MKKMVVVGTDTLLQMAKQLRDRGEITSHQYSQMERRNSQLPKEVKNNIVHIAG